MLIALLDATLRQRLLVAVLITLISTRDRAVSKISLANTSKCSIGITNTTPSFAANLDKGVIITLATNLVCYVDVFDKRSCILETSFTKQTRVHVLLLRISMTLQDHLHNVLVAVVLCCLLGQIAEDEYVHSDQAPCAVKRC